MNINDLSIGKRMGVGFGSMAIITLLLGLLAVTGIQNLVTHLQHIGANRIPALIALAQLNRERMVIRAQTQAVFAHDHGMYAEAEKGLRGIQKEREKSWQKVDQWWEALLKIPRTSEKGRALQQQAQELYRAWRAIYVELDDLIARIAAATDAGQKEALYAEYRQTVGRMVPISDRMGQTFDELTENNTARTRQIISEDEVMATRLQTWAIVATAIGVVLAALLGWFITRSVTVPLKRSGQILETIAEGDMSHEIPADLAARKDEIGNLVGDMLSMVAQLRETVSQVIQASTQVSLAAAEIAQGSADLAQRTEEQASALEQTASSMEELTSTVKQSADNAGYANQLAGTACSQAEQGGQVVDQAIIAMSIINASSLKIANIIGVIDVIAFQTNLLALNAAIEAAHAGTQGRGFAVVASEVHKLAQQSANAAKEIKALIAESVAQIEDGSRLVERSGETLKDIIGAVKKVSDIVAEMTVAAREQATGIEQINQAILQIDQTTQQNAALVEQTAAASHTMDDQAQELQRLMGIFKLKAD